VRLPNPGLEVVFVTQMPKIYGEHYEGKVDEKKKNEIYRKNLSMCTLTIPRTNGVTTRDASEQGGLLVRAGSCAVRQPACACGHAPGTVSGLGGRAGSCIMGRFLGGVLL
jgi:hypothetical protein